MRLDPCLLDVPFRLHLADDAAPPTGTRRRTDSGIEVLSEAEFDAAPAAKFLVPGLILEGSLGLIVGHPGTLKTFLALDLALSVAAGLPTWLGRPLYAHGPVVYVLGEGAGRFKYRKAAWRQVHGITAPLPFYVVRRPLNLLDAAQVADFLAKIAARHPVLLVFDTLNRCLPGSEESIRDFNAAIDACGRLQHATGATVQLLHHPTKVGDSARGGGNLLGAVESELWLTTKGDVVTVQVTKQKEAADTDVVLALRPRDVVLDGVFEHGTPVTSCVIELATPDATPAGTVSQRMQRALAAHGSPMTEREIATVLGLGHETVRKTVYRGDQTFAIVPNDGGARKIGLLKWGTE